jgi:hypothetical protein
VMEPEDGVECRVRNKHHMPAVTDDDVNVVVYGFKGIKTLGWPFTVGI